MIRVVHATGLERIELEHLRDRVGRLYVALQEAAEADAPPAPGSWSPPVDVYEAEDAIIVRIEVPGMRASGIKILLTNSQLRICGEKKKRVPRQRVISHLCSERSYGQFSRVVSLRWTINVSEATAQLTDGVLIVRLPKRKDRRGVEFRVPIKESGEE
jgi:HSP20 family protein